MAGIPCSTTRENSPSSSEAPSSMEYSVWTCRWTKESWEPFAIVAGHSLMRIAGMTDQSHEAFLAPIGEGAHSNLHRCVDVACPRRCDPRTWDRQQPASR